MNAHTHIIAHAEGARNSTISQTALKAHTTPSSMHQMYELLYFIAHSLLVHLCGLSHSYLR